MRMIRLGLPHHLLEHQGRSRVEMMPLYSWKYDRLGFLESCREGAYSLANAGLEKVFQFVNVRFTGQGESRPAPYIYQNLEEAEFVVAT
jgi:intron-binding protein aquarius